MEGSYRLTTITKAKKKVYVIQIISLVAMSFLLLLYGGMNLSPFYLPVDSFIYFVMIMLLVLLLESFFFRILEIKFTQSGSRKFLMAKNS
ncbi:MAG: hypothetical protein KAT70_03715, partial [Thermoplasmata archaeon]|nr:hypothetical protein [Thermoplasmata archaeon]